MGTWGFRILQDDTVADVLGAFDDHLKHGSTLEEATKAVLRDFKELTNDRDDGPLLWLAIARAQWQYDALDPEVLEKVRRDIDSEAGFDRWRDSQKDFLKRKGALHSFLSQISTPNPKPKRFPRLVVRKAPFKSGDCLAIITEDGLYSAALVLAENNTNPEYGMNLIASLDYLDKGVPDVSVFQQRNWLRLTHHNWKDELDINWILPVHFKKERKRIILIGNIPLLSSDPRTADGHVGWTHLGLQVLLQHQWNNGNTT